MKPTTSYPATSKPSKVRTSVSLSASVAEELQRYGAYLRNVRGLAAGSSQVRLRVIGLLLQEKFKGRAIAIEKLRPDDIRQFLAAHSGSGRSASHVSHLAGNLRCYLRYRATCGDSVSHLTAAILNPVHWKLASLPRALKHEEVDCLLASMRDAPSMPKRSYAIVRCALDLGLRCGEIAHLTLNDIDWRSGTVTLRGTKSKRQDVLPLPMATGQALVDYLQHERPVVKHPAIFVRQVAGQIQPITSWAIQKVIKRACCRVGLSHTSAHALRHTVASRLVENGSSLKEVADLLRHRSLNSSLIYAKLDTPRLAAVALPWPGSET